VLLGTTARRLAANRSVARCKLAPQDPRWELLLDELMPHASTVGPRAGEDPVDAEEVR
jgi:hypothetical protein